MKLDPQYADKLTVGDVLTVRSTQESINLQKLEIRKIELRHPRSGDSYLDVELKEIG